MWGRCAIFRIKFAYGNTQSVSDCFFPIAIRVAAQTVGHDLVSVVPIGGGATLEEINNIKNRLKSENRDGKLDSVLEDKEFNEKKLEEDQEYRDLMDKGTPKGNLFYMDYKYGSTESNTQ